jgi:hypothetical protein
MLQGNYVEVDQIQTRLRYGRNCNMSSILWRYGGMRDALSMRLHQECSLPNSPAGCSAAIATGAGFAATHLAGGQRLGDLPIAGLVGAGIYANSIDPLNTACTLDELNGLESVSNGRIL